jgi:hypothetical protein
MSYTITKTDGTTLGTILDGTINTSFTSLTLIGRNYANYGQLIAGNLVKLVENFAYSSSPSNPLAGQLWWDTSNKLLKVYTGTTFKIVSSCTAQGTPPSTTIAGDLWWDTANQQLYIYNGTTPYVSTGWILVGPQRNGSGAIWEVLYDTVPTAKNVVSIYLDGVRTAVISATSFTSNASITGIGTTINAGYNMSSAYTIFGTANNASYLGAQPAANYFLNNQNNSGTGTLTILNNSGLTLGNYQVATLSTASNTLTITNNINSGNISIKANTAGVATQYLSINAVSGAVEVAADPTTVLGVVTKQYVDNRFINANLWGISTAITAPAGTSNTMIATTEFVSSGLSGLFPYKIYSGSTHMWVSSTSANIVINGTSVATASASGFNLSSGATAVTMPDTYDGSGNSAIATTQFVKTASTWWGNATHRSAKFISTDAPNPGINDVGSNNGDFWFQREA